MGWASLASKEEKVEVEIMDPSGLNCWITQDKTPKCQACLLGTPLCTCREQFPRSLLWSILPLLHAVFRYRVDGLPIRGPL